MLNSDGWYKRSFTFALCITAILFFGISEGIAQEKGCSAQKDMNPNHQPTDEFQETAKITGDSVDVVAKYYGMCSSGVSALMGQCVDYFRKAADKELNNRYMEVRNTIRIKFGRDSDAETDLIQAEKAWITLRDATCRLKTEAAMEFTDCLTEETKKRSYDLGDLLFDLSQVRSRQE